MVSSPSTVQLREEPRTLEAPLNHMHTNTTDVLRLASRAPSTFGQLERQQHMLSRAQADNAISQVRSPLRSSAPSCARSARTPASLSCRI